MQPCVSFSVLAFCGVHFSAAAAAGQPGYWISQEMKIVQTCILSLDLNIRVYDGVHVRDQTGRLRGAFFNRFVRTLLARAGALRRSRIFRLSEVYV
uniref:Secreted protein n=1 Tax=Trichogramma kaykai TaxID=54128 RepID=A0ABD2XLT5_9HYME